jgi:DNA-directed RNA polymerase specialized sigma24 family protein
MLNPVEAAVSLTQEGAAFGTTRWSLLANLRDGGDRDRAAALDTLCRIYWPAVYTYLRRRGLGRDQAEEVTQAFFADSVCGRRLFDGAKAGRGRLRALILQALRNYQVDLSRRDAARANGRPLLRIDGADSGEQLVGAAATPEDAFERRWALAHFHEGLRRCEAHFRAAGKGRHWELFEARVLRPAQGPVEPTPLAELAQRLGFASPADAASAVRYVKDRLDVFLRVVAAETVGDAAEIDEEFAALRRLLG